MTNVPDKTKKGTQGGYANSAGNALEKTVVGTLTSWGFELVKHRDWIRHPNKHGNELLLTDVPFTTIYNHQGKTEFLLRSARKNLEIRIECKWQQSAGSVDEKFPYVYLNCIEKMPEQQIIIIVGGKGAKKGAVEWLINACENKLYTDQKSQTKSVSVMDLEEFLAWANKMFR